MTSWGYIVSALSLVLLVLLLIKEWQRENRARLVLRMAADVVLVAVLVCIALPLTVARSLGSGSEVGVLLTEGYRSDSVDAFAASRKVNVWHWPWEVRGEGLAALHVFGYGLTKEELRQLPAVPLVFHPSPPEAGVMSIDWKRQLWPGEVCRVQGRFYHPAGTAIKLLLTGMRTILDSAEIKDSHDFELRMVPSHIGTAVYKLIALAGADTLEQENIPVEVLPGKTLRVLLLAAAPDFENRFLAAWLSEKRHSVATRTAISKGKYDRGYMNMAAGGGEHLSATWLDKFDVVIADAAELKAMGAGEYGLLQRQVAEHGLGLIIRTDSSTPGNGVRAVEGADSARHMVITDKPGQRPVIRDTMMRTLVSARLYGTGKIMLTTLQGTYERMLAGNKKDYASLWTSILQQAVGMDNGEDKWQLTPALPVVDQPVKAMLQTGGTGIPQGLFGEDAAVFAYLAENSLLPANWEGVYWPRGAGWITVRVPERQPQWWYVWGEGDWRNVHRRERMDWTERWIAGRGSDERPGAAGQAEDEEGHRTPVNKSWFYVLAVLSLVFLWVERKI